MKKEIIYSDLGNLCEPSQNISDKRKINKWNSYYYETDKFSGTMLLAPTVSKPDDVILKPKLSGWYKIYVGLYGGYFKRSTVDLKLSSDAAFMHISSCMERRYHEHFVEDVYWKSAEMDGEDLHIAKLVVGETSDDAAIAWVRFVPMNDNEIKNYLYECSRTDTKRIYAANDMHNNLCFYDMGKENAWKSVVQPFINTDVEWLAIENLSYNNGVITDTDENDFSYAHSYHKNYFYGHKNHFSYETLKEIVDYGHKNGIKMCVSQRIAEWGMEYPEDRIFFEQKFAEEHPEYRCIDRDGDITDYLSFAYKEVREHVIDEFVRVAKTGCDAIQPLFTRGWPFVLYEKPFLDKFYERFNTDARLLPLDDERIIKIKCEIMTEFMRELRKRLDTEIKDKRLEIHAKVMFSMYDSLIVGLDLTEWAKEGLVDRIVSDQRRIREILPENIFKEKGILDMEKYTAFVRSSKNSVIRYDYDEIFPPFKDSNGVLKGPQSQKQRISEFMELERKFGVTVYIEIMPREMNPEEIKRRALEIYDCGCNHIALWDTESRTRRLAEWTMWRRIGHKEELFEMPIGENEQFNTVRLLRLGNKNVRSYKPIWSG